MVNLAAYSRVTILCDLWPFLHFSQKRQALIGWPMQLVHSFARNICLFVVVVLFLSCMVNRRSSEIQGTALGKCLRAWTCIHRSMPAGVAQSSHAFVGGTVSTWARWRIPVNKRQKRHHKCRSSTHRSWGTCRWDRRFPQLVV